MDREIPQNHEARMLQMCCGFLDGKPLPEKVTKAYWAFRYCADRIQAPVSDSDMVRICVEAGYGRPTPKQLAGPNVIDLWRLKQIKSGDKVMAVWNDKKQPAKLVQVTATNQIVVLFGDNPEERRLTVDQVSVAA